MKKILSVALGAAAMAGLLASCAEDNFTDKYADPSKTSTVSINQVFTGVMNAGSAYMNPIYYRYYTQSTTDGVFSGVIGSANGRGRFRGASEGYFNTRWKSFYNMLTQHRVLEDNYNNLEEGQKDANKVFLLLSRTMVEAQLHEMLSTFGAVPYDEAGMLWKTGDYANSKPAYQSDVDLYKRILSDLKEVGDYLAGTVNSAGAGALTRADFSDAHGSIDIWRRYTNSLRLRVALHVVNGDCAAEAKAAIAEILNNPDKYPVVEENSQNMTVSCDTSKDDYNFGKSFSQAMHTGSYAVVSQAVIDALHITGDAKIMDQHEYPVLDEKTGEQKVDEDGNPVTELRWDLRPNVDPRVQAMLDPNPDDMYVAYDVTKSSSAIDDEATNKINAYHDAGIELAGYWCKIDSQAIAGRGQYQGNDNTKGIWMSAAEVQLSKAEAYLMGYGVTADASKAKAAFKAGVVESCKYYWGTKLNSSFFKAGNDSYEGFRPLVVPTDDDFAAYAESIWDAKQETVCTQLWLNFFVWNELEAWNVTRRTGFPAVKFAQDSKQTDYALPPHRLPYPSDELNYNTDNCQAAISKYYKSGVNGTDGYYTKLFWAKDVYYNIVAQQ